jgi:hypothetical protein
MVTAPGLGGVGPARVQKQAVFSGFVVSNYLLRRTAWTRGKDEYPPPGCDRQASPRHQSAFNQVSVSGRFCTIGLEFGLRFVPG